MSYASRHLHICNLDIPFQIGAALWQPTQLVASCFEKNNLSLVKKVSIVALAILLAPLLALSTIAAAAFWLCSATDKRAQLLEKGHFDQLEKKEFVVDLKKNRYTLEIEKLAVRSVTDLPAPFRTWLNQSNIGLAIIDTSTDEAVGHGIFHQGTLEPAPLNPQKILQEIFA